MIFISNLLYADQPFTILSKSGLNVRKEPNTKSEKVASLPFGTVVDAEISFETDIDYIGKYLHHSEIIEGKKGFWMKIKYGSITGYIFSGFGLVGEWIVKPTEINKDYRLLSVGYFCNPINYDPKLNWFALTKVNGRIYLKKSEVIIRLFHEYNEKDTLGDLEGLWENFPLTIESNLKDTILYLIGTKSNLEEGELKSQLIDKQSGYTESENFLYPEQDFSFYYENINYQFHAYEDVKLTNENANGYIKKYQIELNMTHHKDIKSYNLSTELDLKKTAKDHCHFKTPQLVLVTDINRDGFPDFIYYSHTMTESCGVCWEYHLFMSDKSNLNKLYKKVAEEISCNCIT